MTTIDIVEWRLGALSFWAINDRYGGWVKYAKFSWPYLRQLDRRFERIIKHLPIRT
jgi:hypothetical protein